MIKNLFNLNLAALYGLSSIGIAFFIGRLGTVLQVWPFIVIIVIIHWELMLDYLLQASAALVGAISGPLLALFTLGIFIPFGNAKVCYISFCLIHFWITLIAISTTNSINCVKCVLKRVLLVAFYPDWSFRFSWLLVLCLIWDPKFVFQFRLIIVLTTFH